MHAFVTVSIYPLDERVDPQWSTGQRAILSPNHTLVSSLIYLISYLILVVYRTVDHSLGPARLPNTVACVWGLMCMLVHASDIVCGPLVAPRHARPTVHQYTSSIHMGGRRAAHAVGSPPAGPAASRAAVRATPTPRPPRRRSTRLSSQHSGWKFIRLFLSGHLPGVAIHVVELRAAALLRVLVGLARALRRGR